MLARSFVFHVGAVCLLPLLLTPRAYGQTLTAEQRQWAAHVGAAALKTNDVALLTAIDALTSVDTSNASAASRTFDEFVGRYRTAVADARRTLPGRAELDSLTTGLQAAVAQADVNTRKRLEPLIVQGYAQLAQRAIEAALPLNVRGNTFNDRYYYEVLKRAAQVKDDLPDVRQAIDAAVTPVVNNLDQKTKRSLDELQKTMESVQDLPSGFKKALEEIDGIVANETKRLGEQAGNERDDFDATVSDARALLFTASVLLGRYGDKAARDVLTVGTIGLQVASYVNQARLGQISSTVMTANIVGAVVMVFTLSAGSEPPEAQLMVAIQEAVGRLERNIEALRKQVLAIGKAMLESLDAVYRDVSEQLRRIQTDTRYIAESIDVLDARVAELDAKVTYFYGTYRSAEQQSSLEQLIRTIRACERRMGSESRDGKLSLEAAQCFDDLKLIAESTAKGPIWTNSVQVVTASDASLFSLLLQRPIAENIGLVVGLAGKLSGVDKPPFVSSTFVNPSVWRAAAAAYVRLASAAPRASSHASEMAEIRQEARRLQDLSSGIRSSSDAPAMWSGLAADLDTQMKGLATRVKDFRLEYEKTVLNGVSVRTALQPSGGRPAEAEIAALIQPTVTVASEGVEKPEERRDVLPPNISLIIPDDVAIAAVRRKMSLQFSMKRSWADPRVVTPSGVVWYKRAKMAVEYRLEGQVPGSENKIAILKGTWKSAKEIAIEKNCSYGQPGGGLNDAGTIGYCVNFATYTFDRAFAEEWQQSKETFDANKLDISRESGTEVLPKILDEERRALSSSGSRYFETLRAVLEGSNGAGLSPAVVSSLQETYRRAVLSGRVLEGMSLLGDMNAEFRAIVTLAQPTRLLTVLRTGTSEAQAAAFERSFAMTPLPGITDAEWPVREIVSGEELKRLPELAKASASQSGSQATGVDEVATLLEGLSSVGAAAYKASVEPASGSTRYGDTDDSDRGGSRGSGGSAMFWLVVVTLAAVLVGAAWWFKPKFQRTR
jgi:hypothetical protein